MNRGVQDRGHWIYMMKFNNAAEGNSLCEVENLLSSTTTLVIMILSRDLFYYLQISCSPTHVSIWKEGNQMLG